jgi:hemoglobin
MRRVLITLIAVLALGCASLAGAAPLAAGNHTNKAAKSKTLYERLGGKKSIEAVVDQFIGNVAADKRINKFFADTASNPKRLAAFRNKLVDQICEATGGPCKYKGKDMKTAHMGMGVSKADFTALVEDLVAALNKFNVPEAEKNELLSALGQMMDDIVEK